MKGYVLMSSLLCTLTTFASVDVKNFSSQIDAQKLQVRCKDGKLFNVGVVARNPGLIMLMGIGEGFNTIDISSCFVYNLLNDNERYKARIDFAASNSKNKSEGAIIVAEDKGKINLPPIEGSSAILTNDPNESNYLLYIQGNQNGLISSGVNVDPNSEVTVLAAGKISIGFFAGETGPSGSKKKLDKFSRFPVGALATGALYADVGGKQLAVGDAIPSSRLSSNISVLKIPKGLAGELKFGINDTDTSNNKGSFGILVNVTR